MKKKEPELVQVIRGACEVARKEPGGLERFLRDLRNALAGVKP